MAEQHDVGALEDLAPGAMRQVEAGRAKILLFRDDGAVSAVSATCPHAGGPLVEGVRHGHRVVCPWHKATFCLRTGAVLEPPAVDGLQRFDVTVANGRILVRARDPETSPHVTPDPRCFVIVGAGAAGAVAAQTLREEGFAGRLILLDRENRVPYDRTLLSKYHLSGEKGAEKTPLQTQDYYRRQRIERRTAEMVYLDPEARRIRLADGTELRYDTALIATGSTPKWPEFSGAHLDGVFLLRSRADADAILARAERSERAVVLGTSFIGMEVAASLRERGLDVTVVGVEAAPFEKLLGARVGRGFVALHEKHGVTFRLGRKIDAFLGERGGLAVRLKHGEEIAADLVVIGFGVVPATSSLGGVALDERGGVPVDATLRVAEGLYAAGDIASVAGLRVEHWRVAQQQGRTAALNMLGREARQRATPVFWTIQYMKRLDYIGHTETWDDMVLHGDPETQDFLAYYVKDGTVAAAAGMGRDQDTAALIELFDMRGDWTPAALGDSPKSVLAGLAS